MLRLPRCLRVAAAAASATLPRTTARGLADAVESGTLVSLTRDVTFKRAFGRQETVEVLRSLLNATLRPDADGSMHEVATINNVEVRAAAPESRDVVYDIHCTLRSGTSVIVELQKADMRDQIIDRLVGYQGMDYSRQWESGGGTLARKMYGIGGPYPLVPVRVLALLGFSVSTNRARCGELVQHYHMQPARGTDAAPDVAGRFHELTDFTLVQLPLAPSTAELADATPAGKWAHLLYYSSRYRMDTLPAPLAQGEYRLAAESARRDKLSRAELDALQADEANIRLHEHTAAQYAAAEEARVTAEAARVTAEAARVTAEAALDSALARVAELEQALRGAKQ